MPVIEAMHFGKPVFLSRLTSLPEIGGEEAFYFESFEAGHMQEIFEKGMAVFTSQKAGRLKKRSRAFNWDKTASDYLNLYQYLLIL